MSEGDNKAQSFSVELVHEDTSDCQTIDVASVEADSVHVSSKGNRYEPKFMIDGDTTTSWQEGEDGAGEGQSSNIEFEDSMDPQVIRINGAESVNEVQFEIVSVYSGDKYNDTCVAEVQFLCR